MKEDLTLVIMAAGLGSRFGGLKQIEPIGEHGEFIIDYSVYDAIKAGFKKVVFIIKEENYEVFKSTIGKKIEDKIKVEYAFQKMDDVVDGMVVPSDRVKPLGTGHAIYAARDYIDGNFAVINADDFYGRDAFFKVANFLKKHHGKNPEEYVLVGYHAGNTITSNGSVKRGVCKLDGNYLEELEECSLEREGVDLIAKPLSGGKEFLVSNDTLVSMNMLGFQKEFLNHVHDFMHEFYEENKDDMSTCEYLLPTVITKCIKRYIATVEVVPTTSVWHGVTYKEDKDEVVGAIKDLVEKGEYPSNLWN